MTYLCFLPIEIIDLFQVTISIVDLSIFRCNLSLSKNNQGNISLIVFLFQLKNSKIQEFLRAHLTPLWKVTILIDKNICKFIREVLKCHIDGKTVKIVILIRAHFNIQCLLQVLSIYPKD